MNTPIYDALLVEQDAPEPKLYYYKITPIPMPEPRWKTFLRCLLWWLP